MKKKPEEYSEKNGGRWLKKMIIINNQIVWRGITYNENYWKMLVDFCKKPKAYTTKKDKTTKLSVKIPWEYPTIAEFRVKHNIPKRTWFKWVELYPELAEAVDIVKDIQEDMLIKNGLSGRWNAQVVSKVWMYDHDWIDKKEVTTKQDSLTEEQKKKMFEEYMKSIEQEWIVIDGNVLNSKNMDAYVWDDSWEN